MVWVRDRLIDFLLFLKGLAIGFVIAVPVGPIGLLCTRRTLTDGRACGLVSGLGAATADALYGFVAAFGVTFISDFLVSQYGWLRLVGGLFLCYLGVRTWSAPPREGKAATRASGLVGAYASMFFLTLANPVTILSFAAVFAGLGFAQTNVTYLSAAVLVVGVFVGSSLWWVTLSSGVGLFRQKFDAAGLRWVNRISGAIIAAFGLFALFRTL